MGLFGGGIDPVTGDQLSAGERASWAVQRVMRRWLFLLGIVALTVVCWITNNAVVLLWWNLGASLAALLIEGVTAMALINQTLRDAQVSRETRAISRRMERLEVEHGRALAALLERSGVPERDPKTGRYRKRVA